MCKSNIVLLPPTHKLNNLSPCIRRLVAECQNVSRAGYDALWLLLLCFHHEIVWDEVEMDSSADENHSCCCRMTLNDIEFACVDSLLVSLLEASTEILTSSSPTTHETWTIGIVDTIAQHGSSCFVFPWQWRFKCLEVPSRMQVSTTTIYSPVLATCSQSAYTELCTSPQPKKESTSRHESKRNTQKR